MIVETAPPEGREDEFNDWYTNVHIPEMLSVPGFVAARRYRLVEDAPLNAGTAKPKYLAVYEMEADDLSTPVAEMRARAAAGDRTSGPISTDRAPVVTLYELMD